MAPKVFRTTRRSDCKKRFVHLTRKERNGSKSLLNGLRSTKKTNHIHVSHAYNQFATKATPIPAGFVEDTDVDTDFVDNYHCRNAAKKPKGLDVDQWTRMAKAKGWWLTIGDLKHLIQGDFRFFLPIDRNITETIEAAGIPPNKVMPADILFKPNQAIYEHDSGLKGKLTLLSNSERIVLDPFEFHVEINKSDNWYPLKNGYLPAKDPQGFVKLLGKKTHWTELDPKTHIGFRGPIIKELLGNWVPKVYWYKP